MKPKNNSFKSYHLECRFFKAHQNKCTCKSNQGKRVNSQRLPDCQESCCPFRDKFRKEKE
jgi:hypothetical protein